MVLLPVVCNGLKGEFETETETIYCESSEGREARTPREFEILAGKSNAKKWKRSIRLDVNSEDLKKSSDYDSLHSETATGCGISIGSWLKRQSLQTQERPKRDKRETKEIYTGKEVEGRRFGLTDAIITLLEEDPALAAGFTCQKMVELIDERKMWDWKKGGKTTPTESVRSACNQSPNIVRVAPCTYALKGFQDEAKKVEGRRYGLTDAIITVLKEDPALAAGFTCQKMVELIDERKICDWKKGGKTTPTESVRNACNHSGNIVWVAPGVYALKGFQDEAKKVEGRRNGLTDAIVTLLEEDPALAAGFTCQKMVELIDERKMWDWKKGVKSTPIKLVRNACEYSKNIVKLAPGVYALKGFQDEAKKVEGRRFGLADTIITLLEEDPALAAGFTSQKMVELIDERKIWDWKKGGKTRPTESVRSACKQSPNIVRVAPCTYALKGFQDEAKKVEGHRVGLTDAIITVLKEDPALAAGFTCQKMVELIDERKMWDWPLKTKPIGLVRGACNISPNIVWVAPGVYALKGFQDKAKRPEEPMTLKEAVAIVLGEAGAEGFTCNVMAEMIRERELYSWEGVREPSKSVSGVCHYYSKLFVKVPGVSPTRFALRSLRVQSEGYSEKDGRMTDGGSTSKSCEPLVSGGQDNEEQTAVKATRLTASGRVSKAPLRLDSSEEWKRVMEGPQWRSKRPSENQGGHTKTKRVKECIGNNGAGPKEANVEDLKLPLFGAVAKGAGSSEKRQPLLQNVAENIVYLVQAEAHGIRCFHCKAKETTKWHVFGGEVSCHICASNRDRSDKSVVDRPQRMDKLSTSKVSSEFTTTIYVNEYTREELKAMADADNKRIGITSHTM